jgi:hypothetical protein
MGATVFGSDLYSFSGAVAEKATVIVTDVFEAPLQPGWYAPMNVLVSKGFADSVGVRLPMPVRRVLANAGVKDDEGRAAIQRGPLVYALEAVDNGGKVLDITLPLETVFTPVFDPNLLGGVTTLTALGTGQSADGLQVPRRVVAIPYFAWANRARGEMAVWIKR